jgi:hypothetical protein
VLIVPVCAGRDYVLLSEQAKAEMDLKSRAEQLVFDLKVSELKPAVHALLL